MPIETQRTMARVQPEPADPASLERGVRQLLANKVCGNLVGLWLLIPEHLRLGTWCKSRWESCASPRATSKAGF